MSISVACPDCGKRLKARDELAGKKIKCPDCERVLLVAVAPPVAQQPAINPAPAAPPPLPKIAREQPPLPPVAQGRRVRWPWYVGGGVVALGALIAVIVWIKGGVSTRDEDYRGPPKIAKAIRGRQALIDRTRDQRLYPNNPSRDVVVVLKILGMRGGDDRLSLFDQAHVLVKGEKRQFNSMTIPSKENAAIWAATVVPIDATELTLILGGDRAPLTCALDGPIVDLARMGD